MARRDASHGRRGGRWVVLGLVLVLAAGAAVTWRLDLYDRYAAPRVQQLLGDDGADDAPADDPAVVAAPPALELPPVAAPAPVAVPVAPGGLAPAEVRAALQPWLSQPALGRHVLAAVAPLRGGDPVYDEGSGRPAAIPASTTKVVTSVAALLALGPDHTFSTSVVAGGGDRVVLVGGGDPFLGREPADAETPYPEGRADVVTLARQAARTLRRDGVRAVRVGYDDTLFTGPAANPTWEPNYLPDGVVAPITALWVDEGRDPDGFGRVADPALAAAQAFSAALVEAGVRVVGAPERGTAGVGGEVLASAESAPLGEIVERTLDVSDNEAAEVLLRQVALATSNEGSSAAGRRGVVSLLAEQGVELEGVLHDGSGLSRANRLTPSTLVRVVQLAASADRPDLRPAITGLPVAGFTGSLTNRFDGPLPEGRGRVRAKTGTLTGVFSLAGVAVGPDGASMAFALMTDRLRPAQTGLALAALDNAAAALGSCRCAAR